MSRNYNVGIIGATGMVGQRFITLLENHPYFEVSALAASARSAGMRYEEAVRGRWKLGGEIPAYAKEMRLLDAGDIAALQEKTDFVFCAVNMPKDEIKALEERYAKAEIPVVSNNSAHRGTPDVPMVIPEINADHFAVIPSQRKRLGTKYGFIAVKPNCSIQSYVPALSALLDYEPTEVVVTTYQAISGAGKTFKDWPEMVELPENLLIKVVSEIHDPVTTTDELIPSGETSSYRSNPLALAEFALSRKDPEYVARAKAVQTAEKARESGECVGTVFPEIKPIMHACKDKFGNSKHDTGMGSTIFAVKPGDGSAREQAASCQKVLGGWANIANDYATKRYRSNLINWGMLPFIIDKGELPFENEDYIFIPEIQDAIKNKVSTIKAFVVNKDMKEFELKLGELTDDERQIILDGCLINYYRENK